MAVKRVRKVKVVSSVAGHLIICAMESKSIKGGGGGQAGSACFLKLKPKSFYAFNVVIKQKLLQMTPKIIVYLACHNLYLIL